MYKTKDEEIMEAYKKILAGEQQQEVTKPKTYHDTITEVVKDIEDKEKENKK
jgi:hypothetical protein